jgi:hydroxyacylglutathione hydrolase
MNLVALPAFADNYIWMLDDGRRAVVVDPGDEAPVLAALDARRLELAAILVTHHHGDHIGGVAALLPRLARDGVVHAPAREAMPFACVPHAHGDDVAVLGWTFTVIDVPGHTAGHIAYYCAAAGEAPVLFCGDTLFSAGCGRLFEGTPAQMHASLTALAALPGNTRVCCAHEYTLANLRFAQAVEPANAAIADYEAHCQQLRRQSQPTLPAALERERQINPFLRCTEPQVAAAARAHGARGTDPVAVFAALRQWKNEFR